MLNGDSETRRNEIPRAYLATLVSVKYSTQFGAIVQTWVMDGPM